MDKELKNGLRRKAYAVRRMAEKNHPTLPTLSGKCAIYSYVLFQELRSMGVNVKFVQNRDRFHCFLLVEDFILDITATQFGAYPKVLMSNSPKPFQVKDTIPGENPKLREVWTFYRHHVYSTDKEIVKALEDWPLAQFPSITKKPKNPKK